MATDEFERYLPAWTQETTNGHHQPRLPQTLLEGVPKSLRQIAEIEAVFGMPLDDLRRQLDRIERQSEDNGKDIADLKTDVAVMKAKFWWYDALAKSALVTVISGGLAMIGVALIKFWHWALRQ